MNQRTAQVERGTGETNVSLALNLDGSGEHHISTGVPFFDHMLVLLTRHALFDLTLRAQGDTSVDFHHTVEDVGICLGRGLAQALGDKAGIVRYGHALLPMDEALAMVALDLSGRPHLEWNAPIKAPKCGDFDTFLGKEFMRAFITNGGVNMHVALLASDDPHHALESIFKAVGRALRAAVAVDPRETGIPSSKGVLE